MKTRTGALLVLWLVIAVVMTACSSSGGGGGGTPAATTTPVIAQGVMLKGSVIVNGIRFEDTLANITGDDTAKTPAFLQDGMIVKVKGKRNDDGLTGTAERIEVENEVRGALATKGTDTFSVHGQTVQVTGATVFANVLNFAALNNGDVVEVHGLRDAAGVIQATRVEKFGPGAIVEDEVRGIISGLTVISAGTGTFTIGSLVLSYSPATTVTPSGSLDLTSIGKLVEVHIGPANFAATVQYEDLEDSQFDPAEGQEFEVEGYVSLFSGPSATFKVNNRIVSLSASVRYEGGIASDLGNGVKVEAEGHLTGGILAAHKITFKENIKIRAIPTAVSPTSNSVPDLVVLGLTVKATSTTQNDASTIDTSNRLEIRGMLNLDGTITAVRIRDGGGGGDPFLQGVVTDVNATAHTFKIAGIIVSAGAATARPNDDNGTDTLTMNLDSFFASLSAGKTVVKAKGPFTPGSPGTITATEVEIE